MNEQQGLFGKKKQQNPEMKSSMPDVSSQLNSINSRMRMLEERMNNLNRKIEINENSDLEAKKKFNLEIKTTNSDFLEMKRELESVKERIETIMREIPNFASREEVMVLKKYIDLWEPLNFVTRDELEKKLKELK